MVLYDTEVQTVKHRNSVEKKTAFYAAVILTSIVLLLILQNLSSALFGEPEKADKNIWTTLYAGVVDLATTKEFEETEHLSVTSEGELSDFLIPGDDISNDDKIKIEIKRITENNGSTISITGGGPQILVYHTHTTEAYRQTDACRYEESGDWRTEENDKNIVSVGELLTKELSETYGFSVIHDITDHEPPKLSTAYSRSLVTMEKYKEKYDTMQVYIDVHRDAYNDVEAGKDDVVVVDGKRCARVMFVVGTGKGQTGKGFGEMPDWESNYDLANRITEQLNSYHEGFTRPIRVKTGRYNQHVSDKCLLIEIGHNANTLEEAQNSVKYVAKAINAVLQKQS